MSFEDYTPSHNDDDDYDDDDHHHYTIIVIIIIIIGNKHVSSPLYIFFNGFCLSITKTLLTRVRNGIRSSKPHTPTNNGKKLEESAISDINLVLSYLHHPLVHLFIHLHWFIDPKKISSSVWSSKQNLESRKVDSKKKLKSISPTMTFGD